MASLNRVMIIGNIGRDPEIKYTQSDIPVANFSVATSESWKDKNTDEWFEKTEWHRVVAWRHLAERAVKYLAKGKQVYVEGKLETRKWEKDGQDHYTTEIVASQLLILGRKEDDGQSSHGNSGFNPPSMGNGSNEPDDGLPF